jgi:hypothetical protein
MPQERTLSSQECASRAVNESHTTLLFAYRFESNLHLLIYDYQQEVQRHPTRLCRQCNKFSETIEHVLNKCNTPLVLSLKNTANTVI